jgi:hypothetical protein
MLCASEGEHIHMKKLLYLDTDFLDSYAIQNDMKFNDPLQVQYNDLSKEFIKRRHDSTFLRFEECLSKSEATYTVDKIKKTKPEAPFYVSSNAFLNYVCFSRIEDLFSEDFRQIYDSKLTKDDPVMFSFERFENIRKNINLLRTAIPHDAFFCSDNMFIPIYEDFLRIDKKKLGFQFERKVTIIGQVTKKIDHNEPNPLIIKTLDKIQKFAFSMLREYGFISPSKSDDSNNNTIADTTGLYIVSPIAVYS